MQTGVIEKNNKLSAGLIAILAVWVCYAAAFIWRTSFEIAGKRFFCLFDDAMVSMRYAKNLASGFGLVWNPGGERVEGFTNPLWTLYMSLLHLFPVPRETISLLVQVTGALCLALTLVYTHRLVGLMAPDSGIARYTATILTAFYAPLTVWGLQGMEVGPLALLTTICAFMALRGLERGRVSVPMYVVLALMTLVRIDTAVVCAAMILALMTVDAPRRRRHLLIGGAALVACLVIQSVIRYAYYGDWLPNTYYLKMTGVPFLARVQRGVRSLLDFASVMNWAVFLFPFSLFVVRRDAKVMIPAVLFAAQCFYSVYVGGDAWEWWGGSNRYISIAMPLFFCLFGCSLAGWGTVLGKVVPAEFPLRTAARNAGVAIVIFLSYLQLNNVSGAVRLEDWTDAGKFVATRIAGGQGGSGVRDFSDVAGWLLVPAPLELTENQKMVRAAMILDSLAAPGATALVARAGALPYFSDRVFIDLLGKNDRYVARLAARPARDARGNLTYTPGHVKWSYAYSIGELKPDVIVELWQSSDDARPWLDAEYTQVSIENRPWFVRRDSRTLHRDAIGR